MHDRSWRAGEIQRGGLFRSLVRAAGFRPLFALAASLLSGFGGAALVTLINDGLAAEDAQLGAIGARFAAVSLVVLGARWLSQRAFMTLSQETLAALRTRVSRQLVDAPFRELERRGSAHGLAVLTQDIGVVANFFVQLPELAMQGAVVLGCLLYLAFLSLKVFLCAIVVVALGALGYHLSNTKALVRMRSARASEDEVIRHFRALFDGAKELKLHRERRRAFVEEVLASAVNKVRAERVAGLRIYAGAAAWGNFLFFALIGMVLFALGAYLGLPRHVMSGYALIFLYMILPMEAVLVAIPAVGQARIALERIERLSVDLPPTEEASRPVTSDAAAAPARKVTLRRVTHAFTREREERPFTLGPVDLELTTGEIVFLVGGNGSGKTTLAKVLVGLYAPESGEVLLDDAPVSEGSRDAYRQSFSAVFSDFFLFDSLLGIAPDTLDERARELLVELQLEHKVGVEGGVFSTTALSQGQRKRLALLVAYLEDRPFYLFDEWAADQDPLYKQVFYETLLPALKAKGKGVLVISHDDRYFHVADRCIKLDAGAVQADAKAAPSAEKIAPRAAQAVHSA